MNHDLVVRAARAMAEADLWPGVWDGTATRDPMPEPERNAWIWRASAALTVIEPAIREECAKVAEQEAEDFADPAYAGGPVGAFSEIFACKHVAAAIRARSDAP